MTGCASDRVMRAKIGIVFLVADVMGLGVFSRKKEGEAAGKSGGNAGEAEWGEGSGRRRKTCMRIYWELKGRQLSLQRF